MSAPICWRDQHLARFDEELAHLQVITEFKSVLDNRVFEKEPSRNVRR